MTGGIRVAVTVVVEMTGPQTEAYAADQGLPHDGGQLYARHVVADVQRYVLASVQELPGFAGDRAAVALKTR
jgi:hypothetical protein